MTDVKALVEHGDVLFNKKMTLNMMHQDIAEQFYPERADFTVTRTLGNEFATDLTTSYPLLVRRDLGNALGTMMRPTSINWFAMRTEDEDREDQPSKQWLEWSTARMKREMYKRASMFTRASKEGDHDIAAFGQCVKSVEMNRDATGLLYRCWHLRDNAWCENAEGVIDTNHRKWKPTARDLVQIFGSRVHSRVAECVFGAKKEPYREFQCRHILMPADLYDADFRGKGVVDKWTDKPFPFVSIYLDVENLHIMEAVAQPLFTYIIPRWQTVSGSQYAYSPAVVAGLPETRLLQAMTRTILEAGEKATNPPMVAVQEAMRSDIAIYAGGITWVDAQYDERLGEVLRPIAQDKSGLPLGIDMQRGSMEMLREAFFLNTLTLPQNGPEMTAYEVGQRIQEYIRQATPIFEPLEHEDNGKVCEVTFDLMLRAGAFGAPGDIPQNLQGADIGFRFESPLHDAVERQKGQKFMEAMGMLGQVISVDESAPAQIDFKTAFRDVLTAIGMPAKWLRSEREVEEIAEADAQQQEAAALLENLSAGAQVATQVGEANQAMAA